MKIFLVLCAGILVYVFYFANPSDSPGQVPYRTTEKPFHYGEPVSPYLYRPSKSQPDSDSKTAFRNPVKFTRKDRNQFNGLFDLPQKSFTYVVENLSHDDLNRLIMYGITLIRQQPRKAHRYASRLTVCHLLLNRADDEPNLEPGMMPVSAGRNHYLASRSPIQSGTVGSDLLDLLPGSTFIPYKSLVDLLGSLLTFLYYCTTVLCCLLVAGFIWYHLMHLPWQQSVSITLSPRPEEFKE